MYFGIVDEGQYEFDNQENLLGIEEETALLIDTINNPYREYNPKNFTKEQKLKWLGIKDLGEADEQKFEQ